MRSIVKTIFLLSCAVMTVVLHDVQPASAVIQDNPVFEDAREAGKWVIKTYRDTYGVMPTPIHVQKLLYYWHAATLLEHNKRLAPLNFKAWHYGAVERRMYDEHPGYAHLPLPALSHKLTPSTLAVPEEALASLRAVIDYYGSLDTWHISDVNHEEAPWKTVFKPGRNVPITDESIQAYYQTCPSASIKLQHQRELETLFTELQNPILPHTRILEIRERFNAIEEDEVFWKFCMAPRKNGLATYADAFYPFLKWPTQLTFRDAVGAFMFFPRELDHQEDTTIDLYHRGGVLARLACSASYGSPLALYYLKEALDFHHGIEPTIQEADDAMEDISSEGDERMEGRGERKRARKEAGLHMQSQAAAQEETPDLQAVVGGYLPLLEAAIKTRFAQIISLQPTGEDLIKDPNIYLMAGLSKKFQGDREGARESFNDLSVDQSRAGLFAMYENSFLDLGLAEASRVAVLLRVEEMAKASGYTRMGIAARLSLAVQLERSSEISQRASDYKEARAMGSGRASAALAKLLQEEEDIAPFIKEGDTVEALYQEAATRGMSSAFFELADKEFREGNTFPGLQHYKSAAEAGNALGYIRLGALYEKWGYTQEARNRYELAGPIGWMYQTVLQHKTGGNYTETLGKIRKFFEDITTLALAQPMSPEGDGSQPYDLPSPDTLRSLASTPPAGQSLPLNEEVLESVVNDPDKHV